MNDLAERALRGLDVAWHGLLARPLPGLAAAGFLGAAATVFAGGRIGASPDAVPFDTWLGLLPRGGSDATWPGVLMLGGIGLLALCWLAVLRVADHRQVGAGAIWATGATWAAPFVIGPPVLGTDVYSAVARGQLARAGLSPYHHGPAALGDVRLLLAIDPGQRGDHASGGPLSLVIEHLVATATANNTVLAVLLLRGIGLVAVVAIGRLAMELATLRRAPALVLTALNPAVLLFVVSGARFEGLVLALVLAALARAAQRRWLLAVVLAALAAALKPVALVAVVAVVVAHAAAPRAGRSGRVRAQLAVRDAGAALAVLLAAAYSVPFGFSWVHGLSALNPAHTPYSPASLVGDLIARVVTSASYDDLAVGGRVAAMLAALTVLAYLVATIRTRTLQRTVGYGLLASGLLAPVVYPWFLLWGIVCLAPNAQRTMRDWLIALSFVACMLAPVGFSTEAGELVTGCGLVLATAWLAPRLVVRRRHELARERGAESVSAPT